METTQEVDNYIQYPDKLLVLFKNVIEKLSFQEDKDQISTMEAQLREISRAMEKLEKMGMASPDTWRAEKTRLAAALGIQGESSQKLNFLTDGIEEILNNLKTKTGRSVEPLRRKRISNPRSSLPKTNKKVLRDLILEALHDLGGSAPKHEVIKCMEKKLEGKLLPGDLVWRESTRDLAWQNNTAWERLAMVKTGILRDDAPYGIWELSDKQNEM